MNNQDPFSIKYTFYPRHQRESIDRWIVREESSASTEAWLDQKREFLNNFVGTFKVIHVI